MTEVATHALAPGLRVARLITGLWQVADMERDGPPLDPDRAAADLLPYARAGLTTFDMADHYGSAEVIAGRLRAREDVGRLQLLTKWVPAPGEGSREATRAAVERACTRLGVERIDLLQYHAWNYADPRWLDDLFWLAELREEGLVGALGVTNVDTAHLRVLKSSGLPIVSDQVCWSLLDDRPRARLAPWCAANGVGLLCYGALAGGFLSERWLGAAEPDQERAGTWSQMKYGRFLRVAGGWSALQGLLETAAAIARRHGVSLANVAVRWVLEQAGVAAVVVGARPGERTHVEDNLRVFDFALDEADHARLDEARAQLTPIPGEPGDEYRKPPYLTASGDLSHHLDALPAPYPSRPGPGSRTRALSGTIWEDLAGFSRAVRKGKRIWISGTTATHGTRLIGGEDAGAQAHFALDKIEGALQSLGARLEDVVRTRVYVHHEEDWEAVSRVHGERLGHVQPANTLVRAGLIGDGYRVEIEAEAELEEDPDAGEASAQRPAAAHDAGS
ncbi:MAG: aldo/keto reductase [Gemmatimonadota bacterium]